MKDYYKILGLTNNASNYEIKKAYKCQAKYWHPDINKSPNARIRIQEIIEAYLILSDTLKRKEYDRILRSKNQTFFEVSKKLEKNVEHQTSSDLVISTLKAEELAEKPIGYLLSLAKKGFSPFNFFFQTIIASAIISSLFYLIYPFSSNSISQSDSVFRNIDHSVSFRYNINWSKQTPQRGSTLCLLVEKSIHASCNLSYILAERNIVEKYDEQYMSFIVNSVFNNPRNLKVRFEKIAGRLYSITSVDWTYPKITDDVPIEGKAIIYTTNNNGNRYMMVFTVPLENYHLLQPELMYIVGTLTFE